MGVSLHQGRRNAQARGGIDHRAGHVASAAEHDVGFRSRRIRRHARGARNARATARPSAGVGRRSGPDPERVELEARLRNEPRLGAIRRPGEGHLDAACASASATASDGSTWPAVPPAAIRHLSSRCSAMSCDVKEDAHRGERDDEARPAVRDEWERDPGQRREAQHCSEVDQRLSADERRQARREPLAERVAATQRDPQPRIRERDVAAIVRVAPSRPAPRRSWRRSCPCAPRAGSCSWTPFPMPAPSQSARADAHDPLKRLVARARGSCPGRGS